jgi:hypothetical protein
LIPEAIATKYTILLPGLCRQKWLTKENGKTWPNGRSNINMENYKKTGSSEPVFAFYKVPFA